MFTGLIEALGEVAEVKPTPAGFRLRVTTAIAEQLTSGDSLAVNGVCLTVPRPLASARSARCAAAPP
jgi:riboflavin synthase